MASSVVLRRAAGNASLIKKLFNANTATMLRPFTVASPTLARRSFNTNADNLDQTTTNPSLYHDLRDKFPSFPPDVAITEPIPGDETEVQKTPEPIPGDDAEVQKTPEPIPGDDAEVQKTPEPISGDETQVQKTPESISGDETEVQKTPEPISVDEAQVKDENLTEPKPIEEAQVKAAEETAEPKPAGNEAEVKAADGTKVPENNSGPDNSSDSDDDSDSDDSSPKPGGIKYSGPDDELSDMIKYTAMDSSPGVAWDDIAGLTEAKRLLKEAVVLPLLIPEYFKGIRRPWRGALLYGPPGTGKTLLAKAIATECGTKFFHVTPASLGSKWYGESERLVRCLFDMARQNAPSTIFIDEIDSICTSRDIGSCVSETVMPQLLIEIDGVAAASSNSCPSKSVMVLGATNHPWRIDDAMRRRLEKRIYIPLPDLESRKELVRINMRSIEVSADLDYDVVAHATEGFSGDDITNVCRDAAFSGMRRNIKGKTIEEIKEMAKSTEVFKTPVTMSEFLEAMSRIKSSVSPDSLKRFEEWSSEFSSA